MSKNRSLRSQLNYCVSLGLKKGIGQSKRGQRKQGVDTSTRIYSNKSASKLRDTANLFSKFIKENFPEVRKIKDIQTEHTRAFLRYKEKDWGSATKIEMVSRINKLQCLAQAAFPGSIISFADNLDKKVFTEPGKKEDKIRNVAMNRSDFNLLDQSLLKSRSKAKFAAHIAGAIGCRAEELTGIKPADIDVNNCQIRLTNCKNGKNRTVSFSQSEQEFFKCLIGYCEENNWSTVVGGLKPAAVSRQIRRHIDKLYGQGVLSQEYSNTTIHAIRKMYARERLIEELNLDSIDQLSCVSREELKRGWVIVQRDLGHGAGFRQALYDAYIGE